jgi:hypothetical protein
MPLQELLVGARTMAKINLGIIHKMPTLYLQTFTVIVASDRSLKEKVITLGRLCATPDSGHAQYV